MMFANIHTNKKPLNLLLVLLVIVLITVIALFLKSEYRQGKTSDIPSNQAQDHSLAAKQGELSQTSIQANSTVSETNITDQFASQQNEASQPSATLPVPAHQLKKLLSDDLTNKDLEKRITALNQQLQKIDTSLDNQPELKPSTSSTVDANENQATLERIQHIKNHLNQ